MKTEETVSAVLAAALAAVGAYFRQLLIPVGLLIIVMVSDYFTGMISAKLRNDWNSRTGILGIIKKLCYIFGVAVAVVADFVIQMAAAQLGTDLTGRFLFGLLVTVWLILNECISILENIDEIGVPVPPFLAKLIARLRKAAEQAGDSQSGEKEGGTSHDGN